MKWIYRLGFFVSGFSLGNMTLEETKKELEGLKEFTGFAERVLAELKAKQDEILDMLPKIADTLEYVQKRISYLEKQQAQQPEPPRLESWKQIDFSLESLTPREIARRKLEWFVMELNKGVLQASWYINANLGISQFELGQVFPLNSPRFETKPDAEYALSQMTQKELEALR